MEQARLAPRRHFSRKRGRDVGPAGIDEQAWQRLVELCDERRDALVGTLRPARPRGALRRFFQIQKVQDTPPLVSRMAARPRSLQR